MKINLFILLTFLSFSSFSQKEFEKIYLKVILESANKTLTEGTYTKIFINYQNKGQLKVVSDGKVYLYRYVSDPETVIFREEEIQRIIVSDKEGKLLYFYLSFDNRIGSIFSDGSIIVNYYNK